ncbi:sensor histidine kinase [Kushneria aurantia]|uniref:histidine kinase n=1 Tax=Kushneria aurantia TaxID=504092 RepID=A0ABV6G6K6_9GAMM|nr:sensor histidine kinase [Kushneria aurantia]
MSLTRRLDLGLLASVLVVMLLLAHGSVVLFDQVMRDYLTERLREDAESLATLPVNSNNEVQIDPLRLRASFNQVYSGQYFVIDIDDDIHLRSRSLWDYRLKPASGDTAQIRRGPEGQSLLVWTGRYHRGDHHFTITTALDYSSVTRRLDWLRLCIWALGGVMAILLVFIQRRVIRLGLKPLGRLQRELAQLHEGRRMALETRVPDEIAPFVAELNHQLGRIEQVLNRSRDGIANLSHALKTPLSVMEAQLARRELEQFPDLRNSLHARLDDIHRLVERELQRARLDTGEVSPAARFRPATDLAPLIETLREIYPDITFVDDSAELPSLPWDRDEMLEVLGNLLDNAGKWAASLARLTLAREDEWLVMTVEDDGPGIPAEKRSHVMGRGTRLDEQVSGHGLGLGIVEQIVQHYGGRLRLEDSALGGLMVTVELPISGD